MLNYYEILEVSERASKEVIEKAYKALAKKYHPDLNVDNRVEAEEKMKLINEAFEVLIDDDKRANYDSVLNKRREIEKRKSEYSKGLNSDIQDKSFDDNNRISYGNGYYTDSDDNFYVNTRNMDDKTRRKLQQKIQERYLEAYDAYLRERGYKLKYKWTFKRVLQAVSVFLVFIVVCTVLFFIPPVHSYCVNLYNDNFLVRFFVNIVAGFFKSIVNVFN